MTAEDRLFDAVHGGDAAAAGKLAAAHPALLARGWPGGGGARYLHLAAHRGHLGVCQVLLQAGDDVDALRPADGAVPLHLAAAAGHLDVARWLLAQGAAVDGSVRSAGTPLMATAMEGRLDVLQLLIDADAEVNREHLRLPQTALDFAELYRVKASGQDRAAEVLRAHGGVRPYLAPHDWRTHPHGQALSAWEQALGAIVGPLPLADADPARGLPAVYRSRLPKKYTHQLLFTVGGEGDAVMLCLPSEWPLCRRARAMPEYRWPLDVLQAMPRLLPQARLAEAVSIGVPGTGQPGEPPAWTVVSRADLGADPAGGRPLHLLVALPAGKGALKAAALARLASAKWEQLALPLPSPR
ncbi:ankyrin repeat domain-containing protein [Aquincola sp. J276]|uniref:ankyrin repeat domain-containing protein n=1 Tax=Aquincola sp. J276 TaxID=2898432 RepID=UPI002151A20E|nr:ankyrin repeat domain-containing protein [Aquincola sp. J276]MCR5867059.1 ankyrin repeat domain-containing protein [Aquincola sp. J276]